MDSESTKAKGPF